MNLFSCWIELNSQKRNHIIKNICTKLKLKHTQNTVNWLKHNLELTNIHLHNLDKQTLNKDEINLVNKAISKFNLYLGKEEPAFSVNPNTNFQNIKYNNESITLPSSNFNIQASEDFAIDSLIRMSKIPWAYSNDENATNKYLYSTVKELIKTNYPNIFENKYIYQRLAIYDIIYYLGKLVNESYIIEYKEQLIQACKIVLYKENLTYDKVSTPEEIELFLKMNIEYGWEDINTNIHINTLKNFKYLYKTSSIDKTLQLGYGSCVEQSKMLNNLLTKNNYENKIFCKYYFKNDIQNLENIILHVFVLYKDKGQWCYFEPTNDTDPQTYKFNSIEEALDTINRFNHTMKILPQLQDNQLFKDFVTTIMEAKEYTPNQTKSLGS